MTGFRQLGVSELVPEAVNDPFGDKTEVIAPAEQFVDAAQDLSGLGGRIFAPTVELPAQIIFGALFHPVDLPLLGFELFTLDRRIKLAVEGAAPFAGPALFAQILAGDTAALFQRIEVRFRHQNSRVVVVLVVVGVNRLKFVVTVFPSPIVTSWEAPLMY